MRAATFSTKRTADLAGATYRQVDYWCRIGVLSPLNRSAGSGNARAFTLDEVCVVAVIAELSTLGATCETWSTVAAWLSMPVELWPDMVVVTVDGEISTGLRSGWLLDLAATRDRVFDDVASLAAQE